MSGEFDLSDNFLINPSMEDNAQGSTQLIFVCFLVVGNIVIANLLIGLTVSKTEEMFKSAGILRLQKTVEQIIAVENMLASSSKRSKGVLSKRFRKQIRLFLYLKKLLHSEENETEFTIGTQCLKITQNVAFEFWHFPPIFVLLKVTCLVTLFDRKLQVFKNSPKWTIFGIFN